MKKPKGINITYGKSALSLHSDFSCQFIWHSFEPITYQYRMIILRSCCQVLTRNLSLSTIFFVVHRDHLRNFKFLRSECTLFFVFPGPCQ